MDRADDFCDAFGRCLCCGEPCTTGGCTNPSCSRCQRQVYPVGVTLHYRYVEQPDGTFKLEEYDVEEPGEPAEGILQP